MTVTNLDKAKVAIVTQHPFFASLLMKRKLIVDKTIPTAGVDQRGQIYYNPDFFAKLSVDELVFVLCHELGHVIGQHASRRGTRDAKNWNIAGDAWINDMLKDAKIGEFIKGGVDMAGSKDRTVDSIYDELPPNPDGDGPGGTGDDLLDRGNPLTPEEADKIDAETRVEVAQAAQAAKMQGKMTTALSDLVAELIDVKTPWYDILERYMVSFAQGDYTWSRPNKRFDVYLPSIGKSPTMGEVVIQVDVSGSINETELKYYNGHLARIMELADPDKVHVLYTDTSVCKHVVFERGEEVALQFYSGGGTDMEEGFEYLAREGVEPEVFICLTDGYTDFNMEKAPPYPVVWCISSEVTAPYGENIHFEMEYA